MRARDIMRRDFVWFNAGDSFEHVAKSLAEHNVSSAPVFDEGEFVGILSVSEMVRVFSKKDYSLLWKKNKPSPLVLMVKSSAVDFAKKPRTVVSPDSDLEALLPTLAQPFELIPVVEGKKMIGVVRSSDILKFFLLEVAKGSHAASSLPSSQHPKGAEAEESTAMVGTAIDGLLALIKERRIISSKEAAASLGLTQKSVEKMADTLQRHKIILVEYSLFSGVKLKLIDHDKK